MMSRSSLTADMSRRARSSRARRATTANWPVAGMSAATMTMKSKTFQPSLKYRCERGRKGDHLYDGLNDEYAQGHLVAQAHLIPEPLLQGLGRFHPEEEAVGNDYGDDDGFEVFRIHQPLALNNHEFHRRALT